MDAEQHTCFWCCQWKAPLYVCDICKEERKMSNYHFLLCGKCYGEHQKNHTHPKAQIWTKENMEEFVIAQGDSTGMF